MGPILRTCTLGGEGEQHFVSEYLMKWGIRACMYHIISGIHFVFTHLTDEGKFVFVMTNTNCKILNMLDEFVCQSYQIRNGLSRNKTLLSKTYNIFRLTRTPDIFVLKFL